VTACRSRRVLLWWPVAADRLIAGTMAALSRAHDQLPPPGPPLDGWQPVAGGDRERSGRRAMVGPQC
jgi:hypothetical protein